MFKVINMLVCKKFKMCQNQVEVLSFKGVFLVTDFNKKYSLIVEKKNVQSINSFF